SVLGVQYFRSHTILHSFPTRRSSDLFCVNMSLRKCTSLSSGAAKPPSAPPYGVLPRLFIRQESPYTPFVSFFTHYVGRNPVISRSEEHTSELQSRFDLVCRLLLEKNK